jgi:hypothetical protein
MESTQAEEQALMVITTTTSIGKLIYELDNSGTYHSEAQYQ